VLPVEPEYLTLKEVAQHLRLDRRTILRLIEDLGIKTGVIKIERPESVRPAKRRYTTWRFHRSVLAQLCGGAR
jgi:hypothetical protein